MPDNRIEIQVCLEIIKSEVDKLSNYSIVEIAKELYKNNTNLNDYDIVGGQLLIEFIVNTKNSKENKSDDRKKGHSDNNQPVREA